MLRWLATVVTVAVVTVAVMTVAAVAVGTSAGLLWVAVSGGSMTPTLRAGDLLAVDPAVGPAVGAVGTVNRDGNLVTHRVVTVDTTTVTLRGDANWRDDPPDPADRWVGRVVWRIPRVAAPFVAAQHGRWWPAAAIAAALAAAVAAAGWSRQPTVDREDAG